MFLNLKILIDNISKNEQFISEHGLSIHITSNKKNYLFDTGQTSNFALNAKKLGVDLKKVDYLILSHGHYDHVGGLPEFMKLNKIAKIYLRKNALKSRFSRQKDGTYKSVSVESLVNINSQIHLTSNAYTINQNASLFSDVFENQLMPSGNQHLFELIEGTYVADDFSDEQNLILEENNKIVLFTGCSHRGIINILKQAEKILSKKVDVVVGGFHLYSNSTQTSEDPVLIKEIAAYIKTTNTVFYTMHCTGIGPYSLLKSILKDQIYYLKAGDEITL